MQESPAHIMLFAQLQGNVKDLGLPAANIWVQPSAQSLADAQYTDETKPFPAAFVSFPSAKDPASWTGETTVAEVVVTGKWDWFQDYQQEPGGHREDEYMAKKKLLGERLLGVLYDAAPKTKGKVVRWDVGTPLTSKQYLGSHKGVSYGLACNPGRFSKPWLKVDTPVLGLKLSGQDVLSNGIYGALMSGLLTASIVSVKSLVEFWILFNFPTKKETSISEDVSLDDLEFEDE